MKPRDYFLFHRSFWQAIRHLQSEDAVTLLGMITDYALDGKEPEDYKNLPIEVAWTLIQPQLQANQKRAINGQKGGAPKGNKNASKRDTEKQPKNNLPLKRAENKQDTNNKTTENNLKQPKTTKINLKQPKTTENNLPSKSVENELNNPQTIVENYPSRPVPNADGNLLSLDNNKLHQTASASAVDEEKKPFVWNRIR